MFSCSPPSALHELGRGWGARKHPLLGTPQVARGDRNLNPGEWRRSSEKINGPHVSYHKIYSHLPPLWIPTD